MKESKFVGENSEKWEELEGIVNQNDQNPEKLSDLFIQLTDDLAYAQTFYKNRSIRVYLNGLAQKIFTRIQKKPRFRFAAILDFFKEDIPRLMYQGRKEMYLSLVVFLLAVGIGVFSSIHDNQFANLVLGDYYVSMTKSNIDSGDPMAVYRGGSEISSFVQILINNARICLIIFASGLLFSVFSTLILLKNGIMVGTFQYFFYAYGGFTVSVATIWLHGTIEIGSLILVGGAGLMAGKGLLYPGTYSRLQGFRISATRGVKLLMAILPFIVLAAFIESFITRIGLPILIKMMFVILCLIVMVYYFVVYPYLKFARKDKVHKEEENYIPPRAERKLKLNTIKTTGQLVMDTVHIYRKNFGKIMLISIVLVVVYQLVTREFFPEYANVYLYRPRGDGLIWNIIQFFGLSFIKIKAYVFRSNVLHFRFFAALLAFGAASFQYILARSKTISMPTKKAVLQALLTAVLLFLCLHIFRVYSLWLNLLLGVIILSVFVFGIGPFYHPNSSGQKKYNSISLFTAGFKHILALGLMFFLFGFFAFVLAGSPITFFNKFFIDELVQISPERMKIVSEVFILGTQMLVLVALLPLFSIAAFLWRNSMVEAIYAPELSRLVHSEFELE